MSFQQGLSGLNAAARNLDTIGNNVANANTVGFKAGNALFADVYANAVAGGAGLNIGIGTTVSAIQQDFGQGTVTVSSNPLDLAVNGNGLFRMSDNGTIVYSRNGQMHLDKNGYIVNAQGLRLTGYGVDATGRVIQSTPQDLRVSASDIEPRETTAGNVAMNLDSRMDAIALPFSMTDPDTFNGSTSMDVYDSLGNAHALSLYFTKTGANTWNVHAASDGVQIGAAPVGTLTFTERGAIDTALTTLPFTISIPTTTGSVTPFTVDLGFDGTTQRGSTLGVNRLEQDGFTSGRLTGYNVSPDGVVLGRYSNGETRAQGQIVLGNFANLQGLQPLGNNVYAETSESGPALVGVANSGSLGTLQAGAVEDSNVDLTAELVDMITAQRVYQANAQTIKAQDAILQTLVNLR